MLLEVPRAARQPTQFEGNEYIRVGSYRKKLKDYPEIERALWKVFDTTPFEHLAAADRLRGPEVLALLDYPAYFHLLDLALPAEAGAILARLEEDGLIVKDTARRWSIANLGAVLFAKNLAQFGPLGRKALLSACAGRRDDATGYGIQPRA